MSGTWKLAHTPEREAARLASRAALWAANEPRACSKCGELRPARSFQAHSTATDGLRPDCKDCGDKALTRKRTARSRAARDRKAACLVKRPWWTRRWLSEADIAEMLGVPLRDVQHWRGKGPDKYLPRHPKMTIPKPVSFHMQRERWHRRQVMFFLERVFANRESMREYYGCR